MKKYFILIGIVLSGIIYGQGMNVMHNGNRATYASGGGGGDVNDTINCTSEGIAYFASTDTAGIWEFSIFHNGGAETRVSFIDSDNNDVTNSGGIRFEFLTTQSLRGVHSGAAVMYATASSYVSTGTWYDIRIEENRTTNEYFTGAAGDIRMLIKGGALGASYVEISETSGNNPYTTNTLNSSSYFVIGFGDNDKIANVTVNGTSYLYEDFTVGSGTFTGQ